jgi:hypothetical protein
MPIAECNNAENQIERAARRAQGFPVQAQLSGLLYTAICSCKSSFTGKLRLQQV